MVTTPQAIDKLTDTVTSLGGEVQGHYEGHLQALVPIDSLESLAEQQHVQRIREPSQPITQVLTGLGSATTEGVAASNVATWHTAGYDGTGVRVAVIDVGFTNYSTLEGSDLPNSVGIYDWTIPGTPDSEHGTACAEIVHDMAPGASIDLHKISTEVELGLAVSQTISDGVDIISMSLGWTLDGPGDGTGYLASIVADARSHGIFYATAAGNEAEVTWAGNYVNSGTSDYHAWGEWDGESVWKNYMGSSPGWCTVFPSDYPLRAGLHWDDWDAVDQDYDLYLFRLPGGDIVASSIDYQNGLSGQTPEEYISYTADGESCYAWVVERWDSDRDVCLRLRAPKTGHLNYWTTSRSITFPADSPDAVTVGAVDVNSPNSPFSLESYSSQGPTFGTSGVCSGGSTKPDIVAYANVSTVSYGSTGFNGTSAATPHVAGAAALVKQLYPAYTVTQLQNCLESEALDLGAPGKDNRYGWGRLYLSSIKHKVYMPLIFKNPP
jgi:subtilisin family serine protease